MHVCVHMHMCVCLSCTRVYTHLHARVYTLCVCVCLYTCTHLHMHASVYKCVHIICMRMYETMDMYIKHAPKPSLTYVSNHACIWVCVCMSRINRGLGPCQRLCCPDRPTCPWASSVSNRRVMVSHPFQKAACNSVVPMLVYFTNPLVPPVIPEAGTVIQRCSDTRMSRAVAKVVVRETQNMAGTSIHLLC